MEINQYPLESFTFQDNDFYDIDFWTGSGYQTKKILGSTIKAGILAAVENIYNADGTLLTNRNVNLGNNTLEFTGIGNDQLRINIDNGINSSTFQHTITQIFLSVYNIFQSSGSTASLLDNSLTFELEENGSVFTTFQLTFTEAYLQYTDGIVTHKLAATENGIEINSEYILPNTDGSAGQVMTTDGAGVVSWQDPTAPTIVDSAKREVVEFINKTGAPILEGTIVYLKTTSSSGTHPEVELADASTEATSSKTIGAVYETTANDAIGLIVTSGEVDNLDTSMYSIGDRLWLSTTAGQVTTTPPVSPDHLVFIGIVTRAQNGNGRILYSIQNGYELNELHDVSVPSPNNGDVLTFNSVSGLWEAEAVVGSNIYNTDGTLTGNRVVDLDGNTIIFNDGKVGVNVTPNFTLQVRGTAVPSAGETIARFDVSDSSAYLSVGNGTTTNGTFAPMIQGRQIGTSTQSALITEAIIDVADDTGTTPITVFKTRLNTLAQIVNRPVFRFANWSLDIMTMLANGNVGIGTTTPTAKLEVNGPAFPGIESVAKFTVEDDLGSSLEIKNGTNTPATFIPEIRGTNSTNRTALDISGVATTDTGTEAVTIFQSLLANLSAVVTRPIFQWKNWTTNVMTILANGNVGIGTTTPTEKLEVNGKTKTSDFQMTNTPVDGYVLTSDVDGNGFWNPIPTAFIPAVESTEIRRGLIPLSGTTTVGTFGALSPVQTGSAVAVNFGGTIRLPKLRLLTTTGVTNSTVGIAFGTSGLVNTLGLGFRFIGTYIYSDQSAGGTNWFVPGARQFCGLAAQSTILAINSGTTVESQLNIIGIGSDATDTNLQIFHNDNTGTATKIDLGVNFPANKTGAVANGEAYQLELYAPYGATSVKYRVTKLSDNTIVTGTITTDLPASTTALGPQVVRTSGSTSQNVSIDFIQLTAYTLY